MGRKPVAATKEHVRVRLNPGQKRRIQALRPAVKVSSFIRDAVEAALRRAEKRRET